jgi:hypothetical protein
VHNVVEGDTGAPPALPEEAMFKTSTWVLLAGGIAIAVGCNADASDTDSGGSAIEAANVSEEPVDLTTSDRENIVHKKATCPFVGTAVETLALKAINTASRPLAFIKDVIALGDTGKGDLGSGVLTIFAHGNHAMMKSSDASTKLDQTVPSDTFSLDFPGSKGSHPGHSGILERDWRVVDSGAFDDAAFERLLSHADDSGHIPRSEIGIFIADNLHRDPDSKVFGSAVTSLLHADKVAFALTVGPALVAKLKSGGMGAVEEEALFQSLTKLLGEDNLVGSAGEFGLLLSFLQHMPNTTVDENGEPAISVDDVTVMFQHKKFPDGWENTPKKKHDWVVNTTALIVDAVVAYLNPVQP